MKKSILIIIVATVVVFISLFFWFKKDINLNSATSYRPDCIRDTQTNLCKQFILVADNGKEIVVPNKISRLIDPDTRVKEGVGSYKKGQKIQGFVLPVDPQNKNRIYLSTAEENSWNDNGVVTRTTNRIYSLDIKNWKLDEMYSEVSSGVVSDNDKIKLPRVLKIAKIDGSKLIFVYDTLMNSPGPCYNVWADTGDSFGYLDLSNISLGVKQYVVSSTLIQQGKKEVKKCQDAYKNGDLW